MTEMFTNSSRDYSTRENAVKALKKAVEKYIPDDEIKTIRYIIAAKPNGRFVPVVMIGSCPSGSILVHHGICIAG